MQADTNSPAAEKIGLPRIRILFPLNFAITFLGFLDTHLLIPIMALYASELGVGVGMVGLIVGLYSVTNTPANIFFGRVIDRFGYKRPLILGLLGDALAMFSYSLCRLPLHLILVRLFHGVSGGLVGPATMSITAVDATGARKGRVMSFYGMSLGTATLIGYGLSGVIASRFGYEFVFYLGAAFLILGVILVVVMPKDKAGVRVARKPAADVSGRRRKLVRKGLLTSYCCVFAQYFIFGSLVTLLPLYLRNLGMEAFHVGMLLSIFVISFILLQFPSGSLSDKVGRWMPVFMGLCLIIVTLSVVPNLKTFPSLAMAMTLLGAAYALLFPSISALLVDYSTPEELGRVTGVFHALLTAGVAIGAPLMGFVAQFAGVELGLTLSVGVALLALIVVWLDRRQKSPLPIS